MKLIMSKKFKDWSYNICAIITIITVLLKIFCNLAVFEIVIYAILGWFFVLGAFERVKK